MSASKPCSATRISASARRITVRSLTSAAARTEAARRSNPTTCHKSQSADRLAERSLGGTRRASHRPAAGPLHSQQQAAGVNGVRRHAREKCMKNTACNRSGWRVSRLGPTTGLPRQARHSVHFPSTRGRQCGVGARVHGPRRHASPVPETDPCRLCRQGLLTCRHDTRCDLWETGPIRTTRGSGHVTAARPGTSVALSRMSTLDRSPMCP
jgi:hypothetical protein